MSRITYLLGAGASANALPLVMDIPLRLKLMSDYIVTHLGIPQTSEYLKDLRDLYSELSTYSTIDNYARILFQNNKEPQILKLKKLKSLLCSLFMFEQLKKKEGIVNKYANVENYIIETVKRTIDPRYKSFFAKILHDDKINDQINILSWNYDLQLEIGIESNLGYDYDTLGNNYTIFPYPIQKVNIENESYLYHFNNSPRIVKLNGTAGIFQREGNFYNIYLNQNTTFDKEFDTLLEIHKETTRYVLYNPFLNFAWEKSEKTKMAINFAKSLINQTDILIVIGYSFPDFNRSIDNQIFTNNRIQQIFVQLPSNDFEDVKYKMGAPLGGIASESKNITNLNEFFIPKEFTPAY